MNDLYDGAKVKCGKFGHLLAEVKFINGRKLMIRIAVLAKVYR
jgi:hypothetical protein